MLFYVHLDNLSTEMCTLNKIEEIVRFPENAIEYLREMGVLRRTPRFSEVGETQIM